MEKKSISIGVKILDITSMSPPREIPIKPLSDSILTITESLVVSPHLCLSVSVVTFTIFIN